VNMVSPTWLVVGVAVACVNVAALAACVVDKRRAQTRRRRISERSLLALAALGGSPGLYAGMLAVRHKTRKLPFLLALLVIVSLQAAIVFVLGRPGP